MMENFIQLITNPYFISLFLLILLIEPIIKFMRRFYPESYKKSLQESESFFQELKENREYKRLFRNANLKIWLFLFGPTFLLFLIYIIYNILIGKELKLYCIKTFLSNLSTIVIMTLGLYSIYTDRINRWLFKDDYQKVMQLFYRQSGGKELYEKYEKYFRIFGYFLFIFALVGFVSIFFI